MKISKYFNQQFRVLQYFDIHKRIPQIKLYEIEVETLKGSNTVKLN